MKISEAIVLVLVLAWFGRAQQGGGSCCSPASDDEKVTILTFYIEQEAEQAEDYIQLMLTIQEKDASLKKAIDKVKSTFAQVHTIAQNSCQRHGGLDCGERIEVGQHKIQPSYQIIRRQPIFNGFLVVQQITISVQETDQIGSLVDQILSVGVYKINSFEWKPFVEADAEETAIDTGIKQAKDLCRHIRRKVGDILAIEEMFQNQKQSQKEEEENAEEEQEEEESPSILRFQVECIKLDGTEEQELDDIAVANEAVAEPQPEPVEEEVPEKKKKKKKKDKKKEKE